MKVMRQLNRLAAGTAVAAFAAFAGVGLAQADGMPGKRVVYEKPWDWGGLYFGVHSGYQWSSVNVQNPAFPPGFSVDHDSIGGWRPDRHPASVRPDRAGRRRQPDDRVSEQPWLDTCFAPATAYPWWHGNCSARLDDILTIGPRLGCAMGKWMPYVTGGYANAAYHFYGQDHWHPNHERGGSARGSAAGSSAAVSTWLCRTAGRWVSTIATTTSTTRSATAHTSRRAVPRAGTVLRRHRRTSSRCA